MPHGTYDNRESQHADPFGGHRSWCDLAEHDLNQEAGFDGCVGSQFRVGPFGGWLTEGASPGKTTIVVDWGPPREGDFTPQEAADLIAYLSQALAKAVGPW